MPTDAHDRRPATPRRITDYFGSAGYGYDNAYPGRPPTGLRNYVPGSVALLEAKKPKPIPRPEPPTGGIVGPLPPGISPLGWPNVYPPGTIQNRLRRSLGSLVRESEDSPVVIQGGTINPGAVDYPDLIDLIGRALDPRGEEGQIADIHGTLYPGPSIQNWRPLAALLAQHLGLGMIA